MNEFKPLEELVTRSQALGANQSFATALVNQHGDGVIFSSLYGRERTSVFSKPLKNHTSEHGLSEEEKQAVKKAKETRDA